MNIHTHTYILNPLKLFFQLCSIKYRQKLPTTTLHHCSYGKHNFFDFSAFFTTGKRILIFHK